MFGALYSVELTRAAWNRAVPAGATVRDCPIREDRQHMRQALRNAVSQVAGQVIPTDALYINRTLGPGAVVATTPLERHQLNRLFAKAALFEKLDRGQGQRIRDYLRWVSRLFIQDKAPTTVVINVNSGEIRVGGRRGQILGQLPEDQRQLLDHTLMA